ncbi:MAG: hypothetical protein ABL970_11535 [Nitrospira sp.]
MTEPSGELIKELYAQFGLAYYHSECLHRALCNAYILAPFSKPDGITGPRVDERMVEAFAMTLGQIVEAIRPWTTRELQLTLDEAVARRNFLAHRFWFERCHLMFSEDGARQLVEDLRADSEFFSRADEEVAAHFADQAARLGLPGERCQLALEEMLERGEEWQAPATQRRLRKQETIVRVWDAPVPDSQSTLIFELEDSSLWQLSDIGLTWTRFSSPAPDWEENPRIKPYLPAPTNPCPGAPGSWDYELALGAAARLVVGLSKKRPKVFVWRLRIGRDRDGA